MNECLHRYGNLQLEVVKSSFYLGHTWFRRCRKCRMIFIEKATLQRLFACLVFTFLVSCGPDHYNHNDYANISVVERDVDCTVQVDNSEKRRTIYNECRAQDSWDITCGDRARLLAPNVVTGCRKEKFVSVWLSFPHSRWSDLMPCSTTDDNELILACRTR